MKPDYGEWTTSQDTANLLKENDDKETFLVAFWRIFDELLRREKFSCKNIILHDLKSLLVNVQKFNLQKER